ncbi:hypothetical protein TrVE_jg988 [Triparma verrucosa]|uniref:RelA/SpoT domain-containing protein n=1 Tax=Triparma verrucosa TaxID=1606542 RepID=A0A9W7BJB5_9STRA|nr:hypothetical protein TrVE_jg988 [Triparma verrucosa]
MNLEVLPTIEREELKISGAGVGNAKWLLGRTRGKLDEMILSSIGFLPSPAPGTAGGSQLILSPTPNSVSESIKSLVEQMSEYPSTACDVVVDAIYKSSGFNPEEVFDHDRARMAMGTCQFTEILVESEMDVNALVGGVFHYASVVGSALAPAPSLPNHPQTLDLDLFQSLAGKGMEDFGMAVVKIAMGSARLKRIETIATRVADDSVFGREKRWKQGSIGAKTLRSLLLSVTNDWRALAIRSAACLYRLQMLELLHNSSSNPDEEDIARPEQLIATAREALHLFSPIASRLGMHKLKCKLDNAAFRVLFPRQHGKIVSMLDEEEQTKGMQAVLDATYNDVKRTLLEDEVFMAEISSLKIKARIKEPFSLWKKMLKTAKTQISEVPDAIAFRVILEAKENEDESSDVKRARERALCYYVQESILAKYPDQSHKYDEKRKDYIKSPKSNGYESLHASTLARWHGTSWPFEVQVRSRDMDKVACYGLAAHWSYKINSNAGENGENEDNSILAYLKAMREFEVGVEQNRVDKIIHKKEQLEASVESAEKETEQTNYISALTLDQNALLRESVFVFVRGGHKGQLFELPVGSTIIDACLSANFHYDVDLTKLKAGRVQVGGRGASCNGSIVDWQQRLRNGDVVSLD